IESVGVSFVDDEMVEVGLEAERGPALFDRPCCGAISGFVRDGEAANAAAVGDADQDIALRRQHRLYDGVTLPGVLPEERAVSDSDTRQAGCAQEQDLGNSIDGHELRRAIARAAPGPEPALFACWEIISDEPARGSDDYETVDNQGRA